MCGATATAIDGLAGDKVGWPRRGASGRLSVGSGSLPSSCMHTLEPNRLALAGPAIWGVLGLVRLGLVCFGWVALMSPLRSDGRFDVAVFRGSVPVPDLCLCLCSDETWGRERQAVGALSTLA